MDFSITSSFGIYRGDVLLWKIKGSIPGQLRTWSAFIFHEWLSLNVIFACQLKSLFSVFLCLSTSVCVCVCYFFSCSINTLQEAAKGGRGFFLARIWKGLWMRRVLSLHPLSESASDGCLFLDHFLLFIQFGTRPVKWSHPHLAWVHEDALREILWCLLVGSDIIKLAMR